jgi:hypothetical protein
MAAVVIDDNEISLDGIYFRLTRPIQSTLASIYPSKVVIGDTTKDSQIYSSVVNWSDWRGGIGKDRMAGAADVNRSWYSTLQQRYNNHLVLPGLATQTAAVSGVTSGSQVRAINELGDDIYAVWGTSGGPNYVHKYAEASDSWGSSLATIPDLVTDSIVFTDAGGVTYLVFAHYDSSGSGYTYTIDGATWNSDAKPAKYLAVWDDRLWGIDNTGQLWYAYTIGTETNDCKLPVPTGWVTALFVARNAAGTPIIYASTLDGLFAHDAENSRFIETQMTFPTHPDNGRGTTKWRDSVYIPSGLGIYKYINGSNSAVIVPIGPDRDDGMPSGRRGTVQMLAGTHNELLAGIDATTAPVSVGATAIPQNYSSGCNHIGSICIEPSTGTSSIIGYNEMGWETKWVASTAGKAIDSIHVSNLKSGVSGTVNYRVWWGFHERVYTMALQRDIVNPSQVPEFLYAASGFIETPWFDAFQIEVEKLALQLKVEVDGASSDETVLVQYATNYNESFSSLGTISSDGTTTYSFGSGAGTNFRSIKFKLTLSRGSSDTKKTPDITSMVLIFRKKLNPKWGHQVQIDLTQPYRGKSPQDLRSSLVDAIESSALSEFTFRDDAGGTRNYYVDVRAATGIEYSGYDERGTTTITLVEP